MSKKIIIDKLLAGETIYNYKERGNSMTPIIKSNEPVTLEPIGDRVLKKGDAVFCKVRGNYYTHLIHAVDEVSEDKPTRYLIGNNHGRMNGWTNANKVYGIVTHVGAVEVPEHTEEIK